MEPCYYVSIEPTYSQGTGNCELFTHDKEKMMAFRQLLLNFKENVEGDFEDWEFCECIYKFDFVNFKTRTAQMSCHSITHNMTYETFNELPELNFVESDTILVNLNDIFCNESYVPERIYDNASGSQYDDFEEFKQYFK